MAISRFYQPSQAGYISQFVPEKLPIDLMVGALGQRQTTYNTELNKLNALGDWDMPALQGYDTQRRDEIKQDIRGFIDQSMGKDLSSPLYQSEYLTKVRQIRDNPEIKSIKQSYDTHQAYLKRVAELKQSADTYAAADELAHKYNQKYSIYTRDPNAGGRGFKGSVLLDDPNILTGENINEEFEKFYDQLKADGREQLGFLEAGLAYKNGWEGISGGKVVGRAKEILDLAVNSRAGEQLGARFDMMNFPNQPPDLALQKMTPEQREAYNQKKLEYIGNELLAVGKGFTFDKTTTNADVAYRDRWGLGQERLNLFPTPQVGIVAADTKPYIRDYDKDVQEQKVIGQKIDNISWGIDNYEAARANPNANPQYYKLSQVSPQTVEAWKAQKYALQQEQKAFKAREHNATKKAYVDRDSNINPAYVDEFGEFKLKFNPYEANLSTEYSTELKAIDDSFIRQYEDIKNIFKQQGFDPTKSLGELQNTAFPSGSGNQAERERLAKQYHEVSYRFTDLYNKGLSTINSIRKNYGSQMTDNDKKALDFYEQKFRINNANIFSNIPEKYLMTQNDDGSWRRAYFGAETAYNSKKTHYSDVGSWTPNAQLRDPDTVVLVDNAGQAGKPVQSADAMAEQFVGLYPQQNIIMLGDEVILPGDSRYPLANGKAKVVSSTVDKVDNDPTPFLQVNYEYMQNNPINPLAKPEKSTQTYTVKLTGMQAQQYNQMKANQLKSDIIKSPNDMQNAVRLINMSKFSDEKLSTDLTELARLQAGDTYTTDIGSPTNNTHLSVNVRRNSIDDTWDVIVVDPETGEQDVTNLPNARDAANYYMQIYK